jgi:hypothetical protein
VHFTGFFLEYKTYLLVKRVFFLLNAAFALVIIDLLYFLVHKTHFFSKKCDLNSTCVLCTEFKYYFQTYGSEDDILYEESEASSENNHEDDFSGSDDDFVGFYDE